MPEKYPAFRLTEGHVSSRHPEDLVSGEVFRSVGIEYLPGDTSRAWTLRGRSLFGTIGSGAAPPRGLALCKFDNGNDKLVALSGTSVHLADPGLTGTFGAAANSRVDQADVFLSTAHMNDRWFLTTGADKNSVLQDDGTLRDMGMFAPTVQAPVTRTKDIGATVWLADDAETDNAALDHAFPNDVGFTDPAKANDASAPGTFAKCTVSDALGLAIGSCAWGWTTANADADRFMTIRYWVGSADQNPGHRFATADGNEGPAATIVVERSGDYAGDSETATWATHFTRSVRAGEMFNYQSLVIPVVANNSVTGVRIRVVKDSVSAHSAIGPMTMRVQNIKIDNGSSATPFTLDTDLRIGYAYSEYDENTGRESPVSGITWEAFSDENAATLSWSGVTPENDTATHRRIYRTTPALETDPAAITRLGQIAEIEIAETSWIDRFDTPYSEQSFPLVRLLEIRVGESSLFYPANTPPPGFNHLAAYGGVLVGVQGRRLHRSLAGKPESWPQILTIDAFPMPENDTLVASVQVNTTHLIGATEVMLAIDDLPRIEAGQFIEPTVRRIADYGLVGTMAIAKMTSGGDREEVGAWVSDFGIHVTNGTTSRKITDDIDWLAEFDSITDKSGFVLAWIKDTEQLLFAYDTDGDGINDRYALIHMSASHRKRDTGLPKITWGHYGAIASIATGKLSGRFRVWSAHSSRGECYVERNGTADASNAYNASGDVRLDVAMRMDFNWQNVAVNRARITHTDGDEEVSVEIQTSLDDPGATETFAIPVALRPGRHQEFVIDRNGEYLDLAIQKDGVGRLAIGKIQVHVDGVGDSGAVIP